MNRSLNVYLCGEKTGVLIEDDLLQLTFQYDNNAATLSVRLPVRAESYPHATAYPFFENLTPEGEAFDLLTKDHISGNKVFSILNRFGADCAGAVAFYEDVPTDDDGYPHEISPLEIRKIIDRLPTDPLLSGIDNPPRLSLAGAQSKFAVYKSNGKYFRSSDRQPTTHIIKITNRRFPGLLQNELFCMRLANILQLGIPEVELIEDGDHSYLEILRYDRSVENEVVSRIHQEDFCQALGFVSGRKYQAGGGPKLKTCYGLINEFSENRLMDITRFVEWIIFNYLIGNTDAHAKNLSLLHGDSGIRLAPFYDLLSTEVYEEKIVDHEMAMLINGKGKYDSLRPKDFVALFENLELNATNMMKTLKGMFENIVPTAEKLKGTLVADELVQDTTMSDTTMSGTTMYDKIITIIKKRFNVLFGSTT